MQAQINAVAKAMVLHRRIAGRKDSAGKAPRGPDWTEYRDRPLLLPTKSSQSWTSAEWRSILFGMLRCVPCTHANQQLGSVLEFPFVKKELI
jgi:hypothetical protein